MDAWSQGIPNNSFANQDTTQPFSRRIEMPLFPLASFVGPSPPSQNALQQWWWLYIYINNKYMWPWVMGKTFPICQSCLEPCRRPRFGLQIDMGDILLKSAPPRLHGGRVDIHIHLGLTFWIIHLHLYLLDQFLLNNCPILNFPTYCWYTRSRTS